MPGLVRRKVTVRSKRGKTYQRTVFVRAGELVRTHGAGVLGAAALAGAALLARHHSGAVRQYAGAAGKKVTSYRRGAGANLAGHLVRKGLEAAVGHIAGKVGARVGGKFADFASRTLKKKHRKAVREFGQHVGEVIGGAAGGKLSSKRIDAAGAAVTSRLRRKKVIG